MGLCKDCKHWRRGGHYSHTGSGVEVLTRAEKTHGLCLHRALASDYRDGWEGTCTPDGGPSDGVMASCDEHRGDLSVGQDFGCIHWEARP